MFTGVRGGSNAASQNSSTRLRVAVADAKRRDANRAGAAVCDWRFISADPTHRAALKDATRIAITEEELCSLEWWSRMKGSAGESWTAEDPWWCGGELFFLTRIEMNLQLTRHTPATAAAERGY